MMVVMYNALKLHGVSGRQCAGGMWTLFVQRNGPTTRSCRPLSPRTAARSRFEKDETERNSKLRSFATCNQTEKEIGGFDRLQRTLHECEDLHEWKSPWDLFAPLWLKCQGCGIRPRQLLAWQQGLRQPAWHQTKSKHPSVHPFPTQEG